MAVLRTLKFLKYASFVLWLGGACLAAMFMLPQTGWKAMSVLTGSMTPAVPKGSLVIVRRSMPWNLRVGDIVTYINPSNPRQTITHRVIKTGQKNGVVTITAKGDANALPDQEIMGGNVVGRVVWHTPFLGDMMSWVKSWPGLIALVLIPGTILIVDEAMLLARRLYFAESAD